MRQDRLSCTTKRKRCRPRHGQLQGDDERVRGRPPAVLGGHHCRARGIGRSLSGERRTSAPDLGDIEWTRFLDKACRIRLVRRGRTCTGDTPSLSVRRQSGQYRKHPVRNDHLARREGLRGCKGIRRSNRAASIVTIRSLRGRGSRFTYQCRSEIAHQRPV